MRPTKSQPKGPSEVETKKHGTYRTQFVFRYRYHFRCDQHWGSHRSNRIWVHRSPSNALNCFCCLLTHRMMLGDRTICAPKLASRNFLKCLEPYFLELFQAPKRRKFPPFNCDGKQDDLANCARQSPGRDLPCQDVGGQQDLAGGSDHYHHLQLHSRCRDKTPWRLVGLEPSGTSCGVEMNQLRYQAARLACGKNGMSCKLDTNGS